MLRIQPGRAYPLHDAAATRQIEGAAQAKLPPNALMRRAGLALAQLSLAIAPHAKHIWIAAGPGNNGGDGIEAARHLHLWGKQVTVTWLSDPAHMSVDTAAAYQRAKDAKVNFATEPGQDHDLCIDALLGIGIQQREPLGRMAEWMRQINASSAPVLALDVPSGLNTDTGNVTHPHVKATHTLSLLTLKPGVFTASGRDASGTIWFDDLGIGDDSQWCDEPIEPTARLIARPTAISREHAAHKGSFGDVAVIGGAPGMQGAALLAATSALHCGAGRVFVSLLGDRTLSVDMQQAELMFRAIGSLDLSTMTLVCGCGGGTAIHAVLAAVLKSGSSVVLDADALNAIAQDSALQTALMNRGNHTFKTVLTPHPLEAARLLGLTAAQVQHDRLAAAKTLAERFGCTVVLKGSGTVIAMPGQTPSINPTGNARLATAGTGDVLAGMLGAHLAAGMTAIDAAKRAVYQHGELADQWSGTSALTASQLARMCCVSN